MAKHGFKILDSDMHVMEPPDFWERYIDGKYKARVEFSRVIRNCARHFWKRIVAGYRGSCGGWTRAGNGKEMVGRLI